jgi:signal peptidase II
MTTKKAHPYLLLLTLTPALVLLDQWSKWAVATNLQKPVTLARGIELIYSRNTGIAWSIAIPFAPLVIMNIILLLLIIYFAFKYLDLGLPITQMALALVAGGAVGNIFDRFARGHVVDFISVWIWPIFNLADTFLTVGVFIIVLFYGKIKKKSEK